MNITDLERAALQGNIGDQDGDSGEVLELINALREAKVIADSFDNLLIDEGFGTNASLEVLLAKLESWGL